MGSFEKQALLGVHGDGFRRRYAKCVRIEQLGTIHEGAKALVQRTAFVPPHVCTPSAPAPQAPVSVGVFTASALTRTCAPYMAW